MELYHRKIGLFPVQGLSFIICSYQYYLFNAQGDLAFFSISALFCYSARIGIWHLILLTFKIAWPLRHYYYLPISLS